MTQNQKYRINSLAKDLDLKSKEIVDLLAELGYPGKTHMAVLEPDEFSVIIEHLTAKSQISDINGYMDGKHICMDIKAGNPDEFIKGLVNSLYMTVLISSGHRYMD